MREYCYKSGPIICIPVKDSSILVINIVSSPFLALFDELTVHNTAMLNYNIGFDLIYYSFKVVTVGQYSS